jgi:tape measure domain-containing protein
MATKAGELVVEITGDNSGLKESLNDSVKSTEKGMGKVGAALISAAASAGVLAGAVRGIEFNKAAEQAQVSFDVMLGSAEAARDMLKSLKEFANNTPLEFSDIRDATQTLVNFGMSGADAIATIKRLGDVSGGNADKLNSLAIAFGQVQSQGKLTGQDLLQFINAGFNPLKEISDKTGESMASLKERMSEGAITSQMVADAFKSATSEGGQFYGMLEKQADTLAGKQSTLNDAFDTFLGKMTEAATGPLKLAADASINVLNVLSGMPAPALAAAGAIAGVGTAIFGVVSAAKVLGVALPAALGPWGIAIAAAIAGIVSLTAAFEDGSTKRQQALDDEYAKQKKLNEIRHNETQARMAENIESAKTLKSLKEQGDLYKYVTDGIFKYAKETGKYAEAVQLSHEYRRALIEVSRAQEEVSKATNANSKAASEKALAVAQAAANELATGRALLDGKKALSKEEVAAQKSAEDKISDYVSSQTLDRIQLFQRETDERVKSFTDAKASSKSINDYIAAREKELTKIKEDEEEKRQKAWQESFEKHSKIQDEYEKEVALTSVETVSISNETRDAEIENAKQVSEANQQMRAESIVASNQAAIDQVNRAKWLADEEVRLRKEAEEKKRREIEKINVVIDGVGSALSAIGSKIESEGAETLSNVAGLAGNVFDIISSKGANVSAWFQAINGVIAIGLKEGSAEAESLKKNLDEAGASISEKLAPAAKVLTTALEGMAPALKLVGIVLGLLKPYFEALDKMSKDINAVLDGISNIVPGKGNKIKVPTAAEVGSGVLGVLTGGISKLIGFAAGTDFAPGGMAVVGEQGPEIVNLPRGSTVTPNHAIGDTMGRTTTVNIYSPTAVDPSEASAIMRDSMRQLSFQGAFA